MWMVLTSALAEEARPAAEVAADLMQMVPERWRPLSPPPSEGEDPGLLIIAAGTAVGSGPGDDELDLAYRAASGWFKPWPSGPAATALDAWLDEPPRRAAIGTLDRALALGTSHRYTSETLVPIVTPGRNLVRLLAVRVRRSVETGAFDQAEPDLVRIAGVCRAMRSNGSVMGLLVDCAVGSMAMQTVVGAAVRLPPDVATMERLRRLLPSSQNVDLDAIPRAFLGSLVPALAKAPEDGDRWVQDLQRMHLQAALLRERMRDSTGSTKQASDRSAIFALTGVPVALDRRATMELALGLLSVLDGGDKPQDAWRQGPIHDLIAEVGAAGEVFNASHDLIEDVLTVTAKPASGATAPAPAEAWRQADADFRRIVVAPNPIGRILVASQFDALPSLTKELRNIEATRRLALTALDMLVARARDGAMPARIPAENATDPFSGTAFHWDPLRQILWSVGRDGIDDGGDRKKDLVMRLGLQAAP